VVEFRTLQIPAVDWQEVPIVKPFGMVISISVRVSSRDGSSWKELVIVRVRFDSSFKAMLLSLLTVIDVNGDSRYVRSKEG
jgi:hypothetical protein